jgi:hypothetical protein
MARAPPVSGKLRLTPTTSWPRPWMLRPVGIKSIASRSSTAVLAAEVTSTTGDAPVTVIVSSRAPTPSSALRVAVNSDGSCRPSRRNVLNPVSEKVTV